MVCPIPTDGPLAQRLGARAEADACAYLCRQGLRLRTRNYRCRRGEIDLVMQAGETIVFVEVRYRRQGRFGSGRDSIDRRKRQRIVLAASHYLQRYGLTDLCPVRFDVISMSDSGSRESDLEWIPDAFRADD